MSARDSEPNGEQSAQRSVCVVTHPISAASEPAIHGLLELVAAAAGTASLIVANLPADSDIRDKFEFTEISSSGTGDSILVAAVRFLLNQVRMAREVRRRDEDILLFFGATSYLLPIVVARLSGKRVILEPRGNVPESLYRVWRERVPYPVARGLVLPLQMLERMGYRLSYAVVALSPAMADDLRLRRYEHKLFEHGARPVDTERFSPGVPMADRERRIGYLGRLDEEKGVDVLIEVVKELPPEVTFVFIGDGALRPRLEAELAERIESGSVELTGWVEHEEVPALLGELCLLVMTSRTEGVPTTALEAMACGTPVCATPVGGIPDVVEDWETGRLLDAESPAAMADQITAVLDDDEQLASMSETARTFVTERYSFEAVVDRYSEILSFVER